MIFQFQLEGEHLNNSQWAYDNGSIEGDLRIYIDRQVYFEEPSVNVVELAIQLTKWLDDMSDGEIRDFIYDSIDCENPMLRFVVQQDGLNIHSPIGKFEQLTLPVETVKNAVLRFLVALNVQLHRINYVNHLDRFLTDILSENRKAIMLFEQNEYDKALALFKRLADETPSVQSLNNFAWMLLREEEDRAQAQKLLQQVLALKPQSPFPFMMLGEIALHNEQYEQAKSYLQQALTFEGTEAATYNLAIAHFHLGEYELAAQHFARCTGDSGLTQLHEVVAWIHVGEHKKAKQMLAGWNEEADDYTGAIEIADVYIELGCYEQAREQFEKEWGKYVTSTYIVSRFAYTYWQLHQLDACQSIIQRAIAQTNEEITDNQHAELDEHWTAKDRDEHIAELMEQQQTLEALMDKLQNGYVPAFEYELYPMGGCQLFGCTQHGNLEYEEVL